MAAPVRTCVGCRARGEAAGLVRVAWQEETARLAVDRARRLGGRGAWLHPDLDCLTIAIGRKAFARALRRSLTPEQQAQLPGQLEAMFDPDLPVGSGGVTSSRLA